MKQQIRKLSPHQNGKVVGIVTAVLSTILFLPFVVFAMVLPDAPNKPSVWVFASMPLVYIVMGYIGTFAGCFIYNYMVPLIGCIEYTTSSSEH